MTVRAWAGVVGLLCLATVSVAAERSFRKWTDIHENTLVAKFVKIDGSMVNLRQQNRGSTQIAWDELCDEDQEYIRDLLEKEGKSAQVPPPTDRDAQRQAAQQAAAARNSTNGGGTVRIGPGANQAPAYNPPVYTPPPQPVVQVQPQPTYQVPPPQPTYSPPVQAYSPPPSMPVTTPTYSPPGAMPTTSPFGPTEVMVKQCSKCKREVPNNLGAGDHCPHCRAYFSYENDEFGNKKTAYSRGGRYAAAEITGSIFGVILVIAAIVAAIQKFSH